MAVRLPLLPLDAVLFPHMPLEFKVIEPGHLELLSDCEQTGMGFGVIAHRSDPDPSLGAELYGVGTLAALRQMEPSMEPSAEDGYDIVITGASRFTIDHLEDDGPYLWATVTYLQEEAGDEAAGDRLIPAVGRAFQTYATSLGASVEGIAIPQDPERLSFFVSASLRVDKREQQSLLEVSTDEERLRACLRLLRREAALLDRLLVQREVLGAVVSPN